MTTPPIQWYPGHIAKAEKALLEQLKRVDVVLEVRDARIPFASHHPEITQWVGIKERVLVLNRVDLITPQAHQLWLQWFQAQGETPYFTDAQHGRGIEAVAKAARAVGVRINQRRRDRGMQPRPVRAAVIGFPNVGKSALINRLLKRRVVESARRAGVTRQLRWVRIFKEAGSSKRTPASLQLDLLDAPGVLPSKLNDQQAAYKLAICDDIGEASYDNQQVTAALVNLLKALSYHNTNPKLLPDNPLLERYQLDPGPFSGEGYLPALAQLRYQGDVERTARQVLTDFRKGLLGAITLEFPLS